MFDKLQQGKELLKLRGKAKELQRTLAEISETVEHRGVTVKVTADQKVVYIKRGDEDLDDVVAAINEASKKVQKKAAQKMLQEQGLSGLLGGLK